MKFKFNVPNKITIIRLGLVPLFAVILLTEIPYKSIFGAFIFALLSISDFLDGYYARKKMQVTEFGKLLDPIADKFLVSTALIFLIGRGVDFWMAAAIMAREIIITSLRIYLLTGRIVVPASNFGKAKTIVQSIAIIFVLLNLPFSRFMMFAAVFLTIISGLEYLIRIRRITGNKIVNLSNLITLCRLLMIIPFVYYFLNFKIRISLLIFVIITLSDKLDGLSARLMNQKTELGSGLDSFTDWTLIIVTFLLLVYINYVNILWVALLIISSLISGLLKITYARKLKIVPVTIIARLSVGLTYITIISILIKLVFKVSLGYNYYLLTATLITVYLAMISYLFKVLTLSKKPHHKNKKLVRA